MLVPRKGREQNLKDPLLRARRDDLLSAGEDLEAQRIREDQLEYFGSEDISMAEDGSILGPDGVILIRPY